MHQIVFNYPFLPGQREATSVLSLKLFLHFARIKDELKNIVIVLIICGLTTTAMQQRKSGLSFKLKSQRF